VKERITKIRFFIDYEKEEQWVNEMCQQGWHLKKFGIANYQFEKGKPDEYIYRNEMLSGLGTKDKIDEYIDFLKETGIELVSKSSTWVYFRKKKEEGPFELYSDTSSKIQYLNRIIYLFTFFAIINYFFGISNFIKPFNMLLTVIAILNFLVAILITLPLYKVYKRRKTLKTKLDIFHD